MCYLPYHWKLLSRVRLFVIPWTIQSWNSPGQNTGVGSLSLLQGIFPTQGWNPGLPHCRWILYQLSHKGSPRILEWVAYPFSSGSSRPRNQMEVFCTAGGFFTKWTIREAIISLPIILPLLLDWEFPKQRNYSVLLKCVSLARSTLPSTQQFTKHSKHYKT